jgi:hypothetical protein
MVTEQGTDHFDLLAPDVVLRHLEELMSSVRDGRG